MCIGGVPGPGESVESIICRAQLILVVHALAQGCICALGNAAGVFDGAARGSEMCRRSGLIISREQCSRHDDGFAVPVLMS